MRLDFNVLWVDDQPEAIKDEIHKIKGDMYAEGFEFNVTHCANIRELEGKIADQVFSDEIDLIMVDWDLGHGDHGQDAILKIREVVRYKDIIFYSSRTETSVLRKIIYDAKIEGVFVATKGSLVTQVGGVFEGLVKKVLDLDHTRGIVMGATSDIDQLVTECLTIIHDKEDGAEREKMFKKANALITETLKDLEKKARKLEASRDLSELLSAYDILQSYDRLRMINEMMRDAKYAEHSELRGQLQQYLRKELSKRNFLGHMVLTPEGRPESIATTGGKTIKIADMLDLRVFLLDLRASMRKLKQGLSV